MNNNHPVAANVRTVLERNELGKIEAKANVIQYVAGRGANITVTRYRNAKDIDLTCAIHGLVRVGTAIQAVKRMEYLCPQCMQESIPLANKTHSKQTRMYHWYSSVVTPDQRTQSDATLYEAYCLWEADDRLSFTNFKNRLKIIRACPGGVQ